MAKRVAKITLGIDVAKADCRVCHWESTETLMLPNQADSIRAWLQSLQGPVQIALEPTSHYHRVWVDAALALGHEVYLINPRQLAHYREAVNVLNKTDPQDAWLLARYLVHEGCQLRAYQPPCRKAQLLWGLLKRRAVAVTARKQLQQSFREINLSTRALLSQFQRLLARIDRRMSTLIQALGWSGDYQRCLSIPGVGPALAKALSEKGLVRVEEAQRVEEEWWEKWFGTSRGQWLYRRIRGVDGSRVNPREPRKSISSERTFFADLSADEDLERRLMQLACSVGHTVRRSGLRARTVTVKLRDADFTTRQASRTVDEPIESDAALFRIARELLTELRRRRRRPARLLGVGVTNLEPMEGQVRQLGLFGDDARVESERDRQVARAVDDLNERFGDGAIVPARVVKPR